MGSKKVLNHLVKIVEQWLSKNRRKSKLPVAMEVKIMLLYFYQYNTLYQIAKRYKISEGYCCKIIKKVETILIQDGSMRLAGRKELSTSSGIKEVLIDVTEVNIERPKKDKNNTIQEKRNGIP